MLSPILTTLFTTLLVFSPAIASPHPPIDTYILPGNNTFPEGIARQPNSPYFYTASITDGTIYRGDIRSPNIEVFIPPTNITSIAGMKVDAHNRLYIAAPTSGTVFVYDIATRNLLHRFSNNLNGTFINDIAIARDGTVYVTDSVLPYLYYVTKDKLGGPVDQELQVFTTLTPVVDYQPGVYHGNGIAVTPDQEYLIVGDWGGHAIYRISLVTKEVDPIDLGGKTIGSPDGFLIRGSLLYSVNSDYSLGIFVDVIKIEKPYLKATPLRRITSPLLVGPATAAWDGDDLLITNFQSGLTPVVLPFTVVRVSTH